MIRCSTFVSYDITCQFAFKSEYHFTTDHPRVLKNISENIAAMEKVLKDMTTLKRENSCTEQTVAPLIRSGMTAVAAAKDAIDAGRAMIPAKPNPKAKGKAFAAPAPAAHA